MRRKKILAVGLSAVLVMSMTGTVWGDSYSSGDNNIASAKTDDSAEPALTVSGENTKVTVKRSVAADGEDTTAISSSGGSTTVGGNVRAEGDGATGIDISDGSVTVNGKVTVTGDETTAISSSGGSTTVGKNVTAHGDDSTGIHAEGGDITVKGDVESDGKALCVGGATVTVEGDVKTGTGNDGESISLAGEYEVVIKGNLSFQDGTEKTRLGIGSTDGDFAIGGVLKNKDTNVILVVDAGIDENGKLKEDELPEIVIGEVEDFENLTVERYSTDSTELTDEQKQQVLNNIKYIVSSNTDDLSGKGSFKITKVDGSKLEKDASGTYDVAKAAETITVHVNVDSGYKVTGLNAGKASVIRNQDGSYTVTVPQGGGVNIEALIQAIESKEREHSSRTASSWQQNSDGTWNYIKQDGTRASNEWCYLEWNGVSGWYHFDESGQMQTGWFQDSDGSWYYLNPASDGNSGRMRTGWFGDTDGSWYYFDENGRMQTGAVCDTNGIWYYFDENGRMKTGWFKAPNGNWYYSAL